MQNNWCGSQVIRIYSLNRGSTENVEIRIKFQTLNRRKRILYRFRPKIGVHGNENRFCTDYRPIIAPQPFASSDGSDGYIACVDKRNVCHHVPYSTI